MTAKRVNSILKRCKNGPHKDKRSDLDTRIQNEQVREFIKTLRKKNARHLPEDQGQSD